MDTTRRPRLERGASAVEYGLLIAGIAAVIVVVILLLGRNVLGMFQDTCDGLDGDSTSACTNDE